MCLDTDAMFLKPKDILQTSLYLISQQLLILMTILTFLTHSLSFVTLCFPPISLVDLTQYSLKTPLCLLHRVISSEFRPRSFFQNEKPPAWLISYLPHGFSCHIHMTLKAISPEQRVPEFERQITAVFRILL